MNGVAGDIRIGVLGGTFDPVHRGHIESALELVDHLSLERLLLMPCGVHAFNKSPLASDEQRQQMLRLAVEDYATLAVDTRECEREGVSYAIDSVRELRQQYGEQAVIFFAMGSDAFLQLDAWHRWRELFDYVHVVVIERADSPKATDVESKSIRQLLRQRGASIDDVVSESGGKLPCGSLIVLQLTPVFVASTDIRERLACESLNRGAQEKAKNLEDQLPEKVYEYIRAHGLYKATR